MNQQRQLPVLVVDLLCGCVLAICVAGLMWMTLVRSDDSRGVIRTMESRVVEAQRELASVRAERDQRRTLLLERRQRLADSGQLPEKLPLVEYFQTVSRLAQSHDLRIVRQRPAPPREYPGLLEHRIEYEVSGSFPDLVRFLQSIEETDFWGDIGYLKVQGDNGPATERAPARLALLTFSLFSALPPEKPEGDGST